MEVGAVPGEKMKKLGLSIILCFILSSAFAQRPGLFHYYTGLFLPKAGAPPKFDRFVFDFTHDRFLYEPDDVHQRPWSHGFGVSRMFDVPFGFSKFGFAFGVSFSTHNVHHKGIFIDPLNSDTTTNYSYLLPREDINDYRKNKISSNYFEVPIEFRFRTRKVSKEEEPNKLKKQFKIYLGAKVGYLANIHSSSKTKDGKRFKAYNFENVNRIRYGLTARVGLNRFSLFAFYGLNTYFEEGKLLDSNANPVNMHPISIGFSVMTF